MHSDLPSSTDSPLAEFSDPRLVVIYEAVNAYAPGTQPDFVLGLAQALEAKTVLDVGCGTGLITRQLSAAGFDVTGVDPYPAMIEIARSADLANRATWLVGDTSDVGTKWADLAIMTGHVAQFFLDDDSWNRALADIRGALKVGGNLAFEARNPLARAWESWRSASKMTFEHPSIGQVEHWMELGKVAGDVVSYANHYLFAKDGLHIAAPNRLRFRSRSEIVASLHSSGFSVEAEYGDWDLSPLSSTSDEMIFVAKAV